MRSADASARRLIKGCFRVTDAWDQAILSNPASVACNVHGEKGGTEIEASLFYPLRPLWHSPSRVLPRNFLSREIRDKQQSIAPKILRTKTALDA